VTGAKVSDITADDSRAGTFELRAGLAAPRYGQLMQNRLLVFKPAIVSRRTSLFLTSATRKHPIMLQSQAYSETVRIKLPTEFRVDELPDASKLETTFGSYSAAYVVENGELVFTRSLSVQRSTIPVQKYAEVRSFYERILAAEQAPAVLIRK
jgi:hypothetical protein